MLYPTISLKQLEAFIRQGRQIQLIDLRSPEAYEQGHIEGAQNIPYEELMERTEELMTDRPIVLYCSRGGQSMLASRDLVRRGYQVINVANGYSAYRGEFITT